MNFLKKCYNNHTCVNGFKKEKFSFNKKDLVYVLEQCGFYKYDNEIVTLLPSKINEKFFNLNEVCMFLAHCIHETGGFYYREEILGKDNYKLAQKTYYTPECLPGKSYHGRGILMITWEYNYRSASKYLGLETALLKNPELVVENTDICIDTGIWYWTEIVRKFKGVSDSNFNATTIAINGKIESTGEGKKLAENRLKLYKTICISLNVKN